MREKTLPKPQIIVDQWIVIELMAALAFAVGKLEGLGHADTYLGDTLQMAKDKLNGTEEE